MQVKKVVFKIALIALISACLITTGVFAYRKYFKNESPFSGLPGPLSGPISSSRAENLDIKEIIKWTNYYRNQNGVTSLFENTKLDGAAEAKTKDMFLLQYFEHTSPTGKTASDLVTASGYSYKYVGENLALGDFQNEKDLVDAWMASEGHRKNILNPDYKEIGVAAILDNYQGRETWISVQEFGTKMPNCSAPSDSLKKQIDEGKSKNEQAENLYQEAEALIAAGNAKIKQGNEIFSSTGDQAQAKPYYEEGQNLQTQGQAKINQAKQLQAETQNLPDLVNQYNKQATDYNQCITK